MVQTLLNAPTVEFIEPFYRFNLIIQDPDDNKFVDCAIAGNATYIVSNDLHFDVLKQTDFPKLVVKKNSRIFGFTDRNSKIKKVNQLLLCLKMTCV